MHRQMCTRFVFNGRCPFSSLQCPFSHDKALAPLCRDWVGGRCIGERGNNCRFRHYYNEYDRVNERHEQNSNRGPNKNNNIDTNFSSPLVVKVKKYKEKHHRVEVDVETGRRRSWFETEEKEIIDLCGSPDNKENTPGESDSPGFGSPSVPESDKPANCSLGQCPDCFKVFMGERGLRMHLSRSSCRDKKKPPKKTTGKERSTTTTTTNNMDQSVLILD